MAAKYLTILLATLALSATARNIPQSDSPSKPIGFYEWVGPNDGTVPTNDTTWGPAVLDTELVVTQCITDKSGGPHPYNCAQLIAHLDSHHNDLHVEANKCHYNQIVTQDGGCHAKLCAGDCGPTKQPYKYWAANLYKIYNQCVKPPVKQPGKAYDATYAGGPWLAEMYDEPLPKYKPC